MNAVGPHFFRLLVLGGLALVSSGCALTPVQAWQREYLAKPEMAWEADAQEAAMRGHTYVSKEAASGGAALPGGGCGCN